MKLQNARIRNFKLLRDINFSFSTQQDALLTVIRAENGSGKTSVLQALRWALYGTKGLDDPLVRLSPADWLDGKPCNISVEIDFSHTLVSTVGDRALTKETGFVLKREVIERPSGDKPNREPERIGLYEKKETGSDPINAPEARLDQMLPSEMLDIFFTDGDAAMTFISPQLADTTKRDQVKEAIRSLLGLGLLEGVNKRILTEQSSVNRKISKQAGSYELADVSEKLQDKMDARTKLTNKIEGLNGQIEFLGRTLSSVQRDLQRLLEAGNYEHLAHQRITFKKQLEVAKEDDRQFKKRHQQLFENELLSWSLLDTVFRKGYKLLDELHSQGVIPTAAVPVLKERLALKKCICGADLSEGGDARKHVLSLISQQHERDAETEHLTSLYYQADGELEGLDSTEIGWSDLVTDLQRDRIKIFERIETANSELRSVEANISEIKQDEIETKRQNENSLQSSVIQQNLELDRCVRDLRNLDEEIKELKSRDAELRRVDKKVAGLNAQLSVLHDLESIIGGALGDMQGTYLKRVSDRMNELFLDMIGADPSQGAIYQGARITPSYSIVVDTKDNRTLNPDHEVNGASQRALTFAFIWALTEVSGVVAPRVIDTPLGMMSGSVKRRVLATVAMPAGVDEVDRQVILFLTQSEIANTEDILDDKVGVVVTLTKSDDYPADLVNDPELALPEIRLCECNHRQYCSVCQRKNSNEFQLKYRAT